MPNRWSLSFAALSVAVATVASAPTAGAQHLNPLVDLYATKKPVFGLYIPSNPRGRGGRGGRAGSEGRGRGAAVDATQPQPPPPPQKTPAELAREAVAYPMSDYLFDGSMEGDFDAGYARFSEFVSGVAEALPPAQRLEHPLVIKTHLIAENPALAAERIGRQLNLGVSGIMFVGVESAEEVRTGLAAMRFKSNGGTRPDDVGGAPAYWGMGETQYRSRADLWPLNPKGELVNWTIVESKEGLAHVREIAAVKGIGVLWPGAGTLGGVFSTTDSTGRRVRDDVAWEAAIQQVLAACQEFKVPCGFPANTPDVMEMRMKQGFSVFVSNWNDNGKATVEDGLALTGRKK